MLLKKKDNFYNTATQSTIVFYLFNFFNHLIKSDSNYFNISRMSHSFTLFAHAVSLSRVCSGVWSHQEVVVVVVVVNGGQNCSQSSKKINQMFAIWTRCSSLQEKRFVIIKNLLLQMSFFTSMKRAKASQTIFSNPTANTHCMAPLLLSQ